MSLNGSATPLLRLEGKVAIITGGASGIGACAVQTFHENGAKVVIADIQDEAGQKIAEELGEDVSYTHCDVSKEEDVSNVVDAAVCRHGKLDIMYSNAGVIDRPFAGILDLTKSDLDKVLGVNVMGAFWGAKHAARVMMPAKKGAFCSQAAQPPTLLASLRTRTQPPNALFWAWSKTSLPSSASMVSESTVSHPSSWPRPLQGPVTRRRQRGWRPWSLAGPISRAPSSRLMTLPRPLSIWQATMPTMSVASTLSSMVALVWLILPCLRPTHGLKM